MKFLICTDVAARGIDVSGLPFGTLVCSSETAFTIVYSNAKDSLNKSQLNDKRITVAKHTP